MSLTGKLVLVTGGNGFIGNHVLKHLLEHGASIRAVVRSPAKGNALRAIFPPYADKFETQVVENMEVEGAYDEVVQDVDVVIHMASPLAGTGGSDNEAGYLIPAREGVLSMLRSAKKSPTVKRVVITSSSAAVLDSSVPRNVPRVWTESDWNPKTWEDGVKGNALLAYGVSKKFAEVAAWEFMEKEEPHFDLIALNAPGVFGAPLERPVSLSEIKGSNAIILPIFADPNLKEIPATWSAFYIDVRDAGEIHARAAFAPVSAGNQRYLIAGPGFGTNKMLHDFLVKQYPDHRIAPLSRAAEEEDFQQRYDTTKAEKTFNIKFRSYDVMWKDFADFAYSF